MNKKAGISSIAYTLREPYDPNTDLSVISKLSHYQTDTRFHFIVNNPNKYETRDYYFLLRTNGTAENVYSEVINTANDANVHYGLPTRKYVQGEGYDNNHII